MREQSNHAAAAAMIRAELKKNGIKAKVRARTASMMTAVDVDVYADLTPAGREEVEAFVKQFQYGHFDGMQDLYEYSNRRSDLPQVKYASVDWHYSDEIKARAKAYIANISGIPEYERSQYEYMALRGSWGDFWRNEKPRVRLEAKVVEQVAEPVVSMAPELASWLDPSGALRRANLVVIEGGRS